MIISAITCIYWRSVSQKIRHGENPRLILPHTLHCPVSTRSQLDNLLFSICKQANQCREFIKLSKKKEKELPGCQSLQAHSPFISSILLLPPPSPCSHPFLILHTSFHIYPSSTKALSLSSAFSCQFSHLVSAAAPTCPKPSCAYDEHVVCAHDFCTS